MEYTLGILIPMLMIAFILGLIIYLALADLMNHELSGAVTRGAALSIARGLFMRCLVWMVLLLAVCALGGIYFSHKIVGPIHRLEQAMRSALKGDLGIQIRLRSGDKFRSLAECINALMEKQRKEVTRDRELLSEAIREFNQLARTKFENKEELRKIEDTLRMLWKEKNRYRIDRPVQ